MTSRWIDLDGVANMRDLGGLPTRDGGTVAHRRLIRSDNLRDLTERDVQRLLHDHLISDVVDLRSERELDTEGEGPLTRLAHVNHHYHSLLADSANALRDALALQPDDSDTDSDSDTNSDSDTVGGSDDAGSRDIHSTDTGTSDTEKAAAEAATDAASAQLRDPAFWTNHYLGYLATRPDSVSAALGVVRAASGAVVVHCAAGKDRTGTIVGLALDVAGVPHEEIIADYALSAERIERIYERLAARPAYDLLRQRAAADEAPLGETMAAVLRAVVDGYGSGAGWLREHGWTPDEVDQLKHRLTA